MLWTQQKNVYVQYVHETELGLDSGKSAEYLCVIRVSYQSVVELFAVATMAYCFWPIHVETVVLSGDLI